MSEVRNPVPTTTSPIRAWLYLVRLSWKRQAHAHQMVWIALGLLALSTAIVALNTAAGRWGMSHWRFFGRSGPTLQEYLSNSDVIWRAIPYPTPATSLGMAMDASVGAIVENSAFMVFTRGFVFLLFFSFLVPIWSLSFSTEALGGERESQGMIWLLTRPLSRQAIYLAKFIAVLSWCLTLNLVGFALLCIIAGPPGIEALRLFWPSVLLSSITFCALFYFIGAFFRRPAIVGLVYTFFLEVLIGNMPGTLKRISIGFYARCMMFESAAERGVQPENPVIYDPVSGTTAMWVLLLSTVFLLVLGMLWFRNAEYVTGD